LGVVLVVGILVLGGASLLYVFRNRAQSQPREPIVYAGQGIQRTAPFYLAGGTYRSQWSAWERAPWYPPCTHSIELKAVDQANATADGGHVSDLAKFAHVPATGGSEESYLVNLKAGEYYLDVNSECGWQIAITPN
jgi:hypothetical protein